MTPFHRFSHELIKKFGLMLKEFCPCNNQTWVLVNGVRQRSGAVQADPGLLGYSVKADEMGKTAEQLFDASLRKVRQREGKSPSSLRATLQTTLKFLWFPWEELRETMRSMNTGSRLQQIDHYWPLSLSWTLSRAGHWLFGEYILRPQTSVHVQTCIK